MFRWKGGDWCLAVSGRENLFFCFLGWRGLPRASCVWFIQFCARRCSETHILILQDEPSRSIRGSIARNCGEMQILGLLRAFVWGDCVLEALFYEILERLARIARLEPSLVKCRRRLELCPRDSVKQHLRVTPEKDGSGTCFPSIWWGRPHAEWWMLAGTTSGLVYCW